MLILWGKTIKTSLSDFDFYLPEKSIAKYPSHRRDESKLMIYEKKSDNIRDCIFRNIADELTSDDFLVVNNTKVLKARLMGRKETGGKVEILVLEIYDGNKCKAMTKGKLRVGEFVFIDDYKAKVLKIYENGLKKIEFESDVYTIMEKSGHVPLPPYLKREDEASDETRYQTVYSSRPGSVAAPTAGLHFTEKLMDEIRDTGVEIIEVTLKVGQGTFQPVKAEYLEDHFMHKEYFHISQLAFNKINELKRMGKNLIAVGTTTLRALESASSEDGKLTGCGDMSTDIFIKPGYDFKIVDKLITNFHLPKSTLFVLMCSMCGTDEMKKIYKHAVENNYRFFSYGDAMFVK